MTAQPPWTFVAAPIDQGIRNVGGRDGARQGPARLVDRLRESAWVPSTARFTRVQPANEPDSLEADLELVSEEVSSVLEDDRLPVVLGGDHGTTYATVRGAARTLDTVGVAYLDVHLDVRDPDPVHTSGSSFRRLVQEGWVTPERVRPMGIQKPADPHQASGGKAPFAELEAWTRDQGIPIEWLEDVRRDPAGVVERALGGGGHWCFSIDVDVLEERFAPGVSAPGGDRLTLEEARAAARAAHGRYRVLDLCEYSPPYDEGEPTLTSALELLEAALTGE